MFISKCQDGDYSSVAKNGGIISGIQWASEMGGGSVSFAGGSYIFHVIKKLLLFSVQ